MVYKESPKNVYMFLSRSQNIENCNVGIGKKMYIHETIKVVLSSDNICYVCLHEGSISLSFI
jgi:hypothetical protein